jgi:dUTP pyrophosphatase
MKIKIKKLNPDAKLPSYAHPGDVGMDMYALETQTVNPGEIVFFNFGFSLEFPFGYGAFMKDKSSTSKAGIHVLGGVFDAGYRGEYKTHVINLSKTPYIVEKGDKVTQLVIIPIVIPELEVVEELSESERGTGEFGSTGKK